MSIPPTDPEDPRGFRDLPIDRDTLAAALYDAMPYENDEDPLRFAELADAAATEAWRFIRDDRNAR